MYQVWYVTIYTDQSPNPFVRSYCADSGKAALDKAAKDYPEFTSMGASLNSNEDWNEVED